MKQIIDGECFERFRQRYLRAGKAEKSQMLSHFCELTECHRKHAVRLFRKRESGRPAKPGRRGPKSRYNFPEFIETLKVFYRVTDRMCSSLLKGAIPDWIKAVEKRRGNLSSEVKEKLLTVSARTIERLLCEHKAKFPKPKGGTKPGTIARTEIPVRQGIWEESQPGFMECDTVSHGGTSTEGQFVWSLTMTDIATHWTELRAIWHKAAQGVVEAVKDVESALPFELLGFDCDNGGEFINRYLIKYLTQDHPRKNVIQFTRSRPNKKNDNAHVEQRNWSHPRQVFYRERLDFYELVELMNDIYRNEFSLLRNHFYPTMKLDHKTMVLSRYRRVYGKAVTPYHRVLESDSVSAQQKEKLRLLHETLDPIDLKEKLDAKLKHFWSILKRLRSQSPCIPVTFPEAVAISKLTVG
jgi:hypothetical protein